MDNYNYPAGSDTSDAPWNQADLPEKERLLRMVRLLHQAIP